MYLIHCIIVLEKRLILTSWVIILSISTLDERDVIIDRRAGRHIERVDDSEEIASDYAKNIVKIARRIEFASIYPPNALNKMQNAIVKFDNTQIQIQGGLRYIDIFLFPAGTIVASGPSCSEQGSGRWLPKPSDTFNKFVLMSKPSVGYKDIPLLWIKMVDISYVIGFIFPDWIADILPGEYPVHTKDGIVKQNFKGSVLKFVTGDFKLLKVPVPYGHIWDSFMRVFLGLVFGILNDSFLSFVSLTVFVIFFSTILISLIFFGFLIGIRIFCVNFFTISSSVNDGFFKGISIDVSAERLLIFTMIDITKLMNNNFLCIIF